MVGNHSKLHYASNSIGGIQVTPLPLPPDSAEIQFVDLCILEGGVVRLEMKIKGILFKRIHQRGSRRYQPVWEDPTHHFDGPMILDNDKAADLEAIFGNYLLEQKLSIEDLVKQKQLSDGNKSNG